MSDIPAISTEYSSTYKRVNVAGIFGGIIPGGLEAIVYSEERRAEKVLEVPTLAPNRMTLRRIVESELIIDPMQMVSVHRWLGEKIQEYERIFGHIPTPEEIQNKTGRHPQQ